MTLEILIHLVNAAFSVVLIIVLSNLFTFIKTFTKVIIERLDMLHNGYQQVLYDYRDTIKQNDGLMLRVNSIQQENEMLRAKLHALQKQ